MSISTHKNTLKRLTKIHEKKNPSPYLSVIYMDENFEIIPVDNPNPSGVLVVPLPMTIEEWEAAGKR